MRVKLARAFRNMKQLGQAVAWYCNIRTHSGQLSLGDLPGGHPKRRFSFSILFSKGSHSTENFYFPFSDHLEDSL